MQASSAFPLLNQVQEWLLWANTQLSPLRDDKLMQVLQICAWNEMC